MEKRIAYADVTSTLMKSVNTIDQQLKKTGIDLKLLELIKYRVSQINGCAFCLDMHHKEAINLGEKELRLHSLPAWKECPFYSEKERALLAFAEAVTHANRQEVNGELFERMQVHFSKSEIGDWTIAITHINTWNRINKVFRPTPGEYTVGQFG